MATAQEILNHQLQGIMLHYDMMCLYHFFGKDKACRYHNRQALSEMDAHMSTALALIDKAGMITDTGPIARVKLPDVKAADIPYTKEEKDALNDQILKIWARWEESTVELYEAQIKKEPDCVLWKKLCMEAESEFVKIKRMLG